MAAFAEPPRAARGGLDQPSVGALVIGLAGCVLFAAAPHRDTYWAAAPAVIAFALLPAFFPSVRARLDTPLCPLNWVLMLFMFQLVIDPLLLCWVGPFKNTLPLLPDSGSINAGQLVSIVAWVGFVAGATIATSWHPTVPPALRSLRARPRPLVTTGRLSGAFAVIGIGGMVLAYHSPGALLDYFKHPSGHVSVENTVGQSGPVNVASLLLRPFLAASLVIPWSLWIDRRLAGQRLAWRTLAIALPVAIASSTYSYNRASVIAPVVAIIAVYGGRVQRLRFGLVVALALITLVVATGVRAYRTSDRSLVQVLTNPSARARILDNVSLNQEVQIYTSAPQFLGFLLEHTQFGHKPTYGKTLVSSLMYPVPLLGKPFRPSSGTLVFNRLIYGNTKFPDQVVPFQGELFLDFTFPGVFVGYLCFGLAVAAVQRAVECARTAFGSFGWQYAGLWLAYLVIGSISNVCQTAIYFFWPLLLFQVLRADRAGTIRTG